jgi:hypothetical protein
MQAVKAQFHQGFEEGVRAKGASIQALSRSRALIEP